MSDMTRGAFTRAAVRRTDKEANSTANTNTKARANQARANYLAGAA
jgi:hypothetical protein